MAKGYQGASTISQLPLIMEVFSITFNGAAASVRNEPVRASKESALGSILLTGITHHLRKLRRAMSHFFRCSPFR